MNCKNIGSTDDRLLHVVVLAALQIYVINYYCYYHLC